MSTGDHPSHNVGNPYPYEYYVGDPPPFQWPSYWPHYVPTTPYYYSAPMRMGWVCPKCGCVYSPDWTYCTRCNTQFGVTYTTSAETPKDRVTVAETPKDSRTVGGSGNP